MKLKILFPALCALMISFVGCKKDEPQEPKEPATQEENNQKEEDKDTKGPKLNVYEIEADAAGGEYQIQLTSPSSWSALPDKSWVSVDPNTGIGNAIVTVKVKPGVETDTAKIKFINDAGAQILIVYRTIQGKANGGFSVAENKQVKFAPGNLQYQASTNTWRFAEHQYDILGNDNANISSTYDGWIDLFGWGTGNNPTNKSISSSDYSTFVDWGTNKIGSYAANTWRTLSNDEWDYIFSARPNASQLYGTATVCGQTGLIVMPDNTLNTLDSLAFKAGVGSFSQNIYSSADWAKLESVGCLFLPASGIRSGNGVGNVGSDGNYWSSTPGDALRAYYVAFGANYLTPQDYYNRNYGQSVRLAQDL